MTCLPGGHNVLSRMDGMKKEHRFWESWRERFQSCSENENVDKSVRKLLYEQISQTFSGRI